MTKRHEDPKLLYRIEFKDKYACAKAFSEHENFGERLRTADEYVPTTSRIELYRTEVMPWCRYRIPESWGTSEELNILLHNHLVLRKIVSRYGDSEL